MSLATAIQEKWGNMPLTDVERCVELIEKKAADLGVEITGTATRNAYVAIESAELRHRLAYVHLGYISLRNDEMEGYYEDVPLTYYERKPHKHLQPEIPKKLCEHCFSVLPTSGSACWCQD